MSIDIFSTNSYFSSAKIRNRYSHTAVHFGVKAKETKTKFLHCTGCLNSIKNPIKHDLLLILVLVRHQNFLNIEQLQTPTMGIIINKK